jgi:hypothetical protein
MKNYLHSWERKISTRARFHHILDPYTNQVPNNIRLWVIHMPLARKGNLKRQVLVLLFYFSQHNITLGRNKDCKSL